MTELTQTPDGGGVDPPVGHGRRVTLRDVAAAVGLTANTVSRALAGKDNVRESTRQAIRAEAERLGYVPNSMARSLVLGAAMTLGLVITNPSNPLYARLISAIEQRGRLLGYSLLLVATEENPEYERTATKELLRWGVDGAMIVPVLHESSHLHQLQRAGIPIVLIYRDIPELGCDFVGTNYNSGARDATRHLLSEGVDSLWLLEEDLAIPSVEQRIVAFHAAVAGLGRPVRAEVMRVPSARRRATMLPWDPAEAYELVRHRVAEQGPPGAILAGSDYLAIGAYRALTEAGLRIPDDVLIAGYGDHAFSTYINPPLTSVSLPTDQIGEKAVDLLMARLMHQGRNAEPSKILFEPELVVRASSQR